MQTTSPERIRAALAAGSIKKIDVIRRAGVHRNTLTGVEAETWNPTWDTLSKLCTALSDIEREQAAAAAK